MACLKRLRRNQVCWPRLLWDHQSIALQDGGITRIVSVAMRAEGCKGPSLVPTQNGHSTTSASVLRAPCQHPFP